MYEFLDNFFGFGEPFDLVFNTGKTKDMNPAYWSKTENGYKATCRTVGIAPDDVYLRIEKLSQIDFSKLHNREERKTGAGYKWDFKPDEMTKIQTSDEVVKIIYDKIGLNKKKIKKLLKANDK